MPGTRRRPRWSTELTEMAGRILQGGPAAGRPRRRVRQREARPGAYIVEHSIDHRRRGAGGPPAAARGPALRPRHRPVPAGHRQAGAAVERIVQKPGALDPGEWELMMQHPLLGLSVPPRRLDPPRLAKSVVRAHHERWDGSGQPGRPDRRGDRARWPGSRRRPTSSTRSRTRRSTQPAMPRTRASRCPRRLRLPVRPACGRRVPGRRGSLVEQVERRAHDRLRVDLVVAIDVLEVARLAEAGHAERGERHRVDRRQGRPSAFGSPSSTLTTGAARSAGNSWSRTSAGWSPKPASCPQRAVDQVGAREADHVAGVAERVGRAQDSGTVAPCAHKRHRLAFPWERRSGYPPA